MQTVAILNRLNGVVIGHRIGCAETSITRLVGLLGRKNLEAGEGIWIRPSSGIHTFGMRFTIDVVGLDREMRVIKLWSRVKPHRVTSVNTKVRSVLELAAGEIALRSIQLGDVLNVSPLQDYGANPSQVSANRTGWPLPTSYS